MRKILLRCDDRRKISKRKCTLRQNDLKVVPDERPGRDENIKNTK